MFRNTQHTLYTLCRSLKVSNLVYIAFSIETTANGVIWLHIVVNPTTSLNNIVTLSKTYKPIMNHIIGAYVIAKSRKNVLRMRIKILNRHMCTFKPAGCFR